jgi:phosphatidylinositol glycan class M
MNSIIKSIFINHRYLTSLIIRYLIIIITEILYYKFNILYTDIDYHVFSDGAKELFLGKNPYERETYRYTPILAFLMIPNVFFYYSFGKFLLSSIDVFVGFLIEKLLIVQNKKNNFVYNSLFYLYNPIIIVICTRGSADCIITFLVVLSLLLLEEKYYFLSAFVYGFSVHFKIYPIIYAPAIYLYLINKIYNNNNNNNNNNKNNNKNNSKLKIIIQKIYSPIFLVIKNIFKYYSLIYILISSFTFLILLLIFYKLIGYKFLYEYLLYHIIRKDHRHNYSMFYYLIYLTYNSKLSKFLSLITFFPQIILILLTTLIMYEKINLCLIILTMIFVVFNKVITAQYFIWYLCLMPLIVDRNLLFKRKKGIFLFGIWMFFEMIWNSFSHLLEFNGKNKFIEMWLIDVCFFLINCFIIKEIIVNNVDL